MEIFKIFLRIPSVVRAIYFLRIWGYKFYTVIPISKAINQNGYKEKIGKAIRSITEILNDNKNLKTEILEYFSSEEPYHYMLIEEGRVEFEIVLLSFLMKEINLLQIFDKEIEMLPKEADEKYGLVQLGKGEIFTHEGVKFRDDFYYFNPFVRLEIRGIEPPKLIQTLSKCNTAENSLLLRLDCNLSVSLSDYKPIYFEYFEVYYGKEINLDNFEFPFSKNDTYFCVFNPKTTKKIQFRLSLKEDKKWIEVEELWNYKESQEIYITRYLHSIYDDSICQFNHIDGSINVYMNKEYNKRYASQISSHANSHIKLWLIKGLIDIKDWAKLILYYFDDYDLLIDAFTGKLTEEIFEEELYRK